MPVCEGCGGSYDDKFKFCPYCGRAKPKPQALKVEVSISSDARYETCQIRGRIAKGSASTVSIGEFWADAIGPDGKYNAGESPLYYVYPSGLFAVKRSYASSGYSGERIAHTFLVNQLAKLGWDAIGSGEYWWETRFRRRAGGDHRKAWKIWSLYIARSGFLRVNFTLCRFPDQLKENKTLESQYVMTGKSFEFRGTAMSRNFDWAGFHQPKTDERQKILNQFLHKMAKEGYDLLDSATNEALKKCMIENEQLTKEFWWFHVFLQFE